MGLESMQCICMSIFFSILFYRTDNDMVKSLHVSGPSYGHSPSQVVYTNASPIAAAGYWKTNGEWFVYRWPSTISKAKIRNTCWMELCAVVLATRLWGHRWSDYKVNLKTDNLPVVKAWSTYHVY